MNETSKQLIALMAAIHAAYQKGEFAPPECEEDCGFGRQGQLWVHEIDKKRGVSIDLYDLFDDGLPELEGMEFDSMCPADGKPITEFDDSFELTLEYVPEEVQQRIYDWIKSLWHPVTNVYRLLLRAKDGREQRTLAWFPTEEVRKQYYDKAKKRGLTIIEEN